MSAAAYAVAPAILTVREHKRAGQLIVITTNVRGAAIETENVFVAAGLLERKTRQEQRCPTR